MKSTTPVTKRYHLFLQEMKHCRLRAGVRRAVKRLSIRADRAAWRARLREARFS